MAKLILKAPYYKPGSHTETGSGRGGYAQYIATREGVERPHRDGMVGYIGERPGSCGLFSDEGTPLVLERIKAEADAHPGNIWTLIFSLWRGDAERTGYNNADSWRDLLRSRRNDIAKKMHIAPENLRWYAAFHNKEMHPHVHMMVWSADPDEPYLSRKGIENIKSVIAGDIFREENLEIYRRQTKLRDDIRHEFRERMAKLAREIYANSFSHPDFEIKFIALAKRVGKAKGKKAYGYLDKKTKRQVDEIVRYIGEDERISEMYDLWHKCRCEVFQNYTDAMPDKLPIEKNPEFKPLRNGVVNLAAEYAKQPNAFSETDKPQGGFSFANCAWNLFRLASVTIENRAQKYIPENDEDEDIDKELRREIRAKNNGELYFG